MQKIVNDNIILIGTAHVSKKSVAEVREAIEKYKPDIVAVELCDKRYQTLTQKDLWEKTDIAQVIRSGRGFLLLAQTFLAMIQRKLGKEFGVEPGAEMLVAIEEAKKHKLKIALVDRDITVTFRRAWRLMTLREKLRLFWYSTKALVGYDRLQEELEEELKQKQEQKQPPKPEAKLEKIEPSDKSMKSEPEVKKLQEPPAKESKEALLDQLMKEDVISALMEELRKVVPNATSALIDERDQYISKKIHGYVTGKEEKFIKYDEKAQVAESSKPLKKQPQQFQQPQQPQQPKQQQQHHQPKKPQRVLAVVGAGHLTGIERSLARPEKLPELKTLEEVPRKRVSIMKIIGYLIPILFIAAFAYLLYFGRWGDIYNVLWAWFLINGICSAIGALLALGHPLSVLTAFFAAPLTSLNPAIGAGWVAGYVELKVRTPTVKDIRQLRAIETMKDFFRNKVIRVLMVMALANLGSMIGTFIAGYYIGTVVF
jgi:pheromone shutdown protein TraB